MLKRRSFLKLSAAAGGAFMLGFNLTGCGDNSGMTTTPDAGTPDATPEVPVVNTDINAYIRIGSDDTVTLIIPRTEMGQGILTALAMILAEDLEADWTKVRAEHAPSDVTRYGFQLTAGSSSVRQSYQPLRVVGAAARDMLIAAAAQTWDVPASECRAEQGQVIHAGTDRRLRFGELAELAATMPVPESPVLKDAADFRLIGTSVPRLDTDSKSDGTATFGLDVTVPDMLVATVARSPVFGGTVASFDDTAALAVPGVRQVAQIPSGVAVIADHFWAAKKGREALEITWNEGENATLSSADIFATMRSVVDENSIEALLEGTPEEVIAGSERKLESHYELPYLAHAAMEPMNATAHVQADRCDIWAPTQSQTLTHNEIVGITGLTRDKIHIHTTMLGGGFGRRANFDFVTEAVQVSKAAGKPVKVVWTREDDTQGGYYRPAVYTKISGSLDADGWPNALVFKTVAPSMPFITDATTGLDPTAVEGMVEVPSQGLEGLIYGFPNLRVTYKNPGFASIPVFFWRSVGASQNAFTLESFIDELAVLGGKDPVDLRLHLLAEDPRGARVIQRVAERSGWGGSLPEGRARGVAIFRSFGSYVAHVVEVSNDANKPRVHKVTSVVDCGQVINPNTVEAQIEGAMIYGLSAALYGQVRIENGRPVESNFHDYPVIRMNEMPQVDVHVIAEGDPIGGLGEPGLPAIAPAVSNALYSLTNTRIRKLPIVPPAA